MRTLAALALVACNPVEPLELPEDLTAFGAPVGVRTVVEDELSVEVWYPATDREEAPEEVVDFTDFLSDEFMERLGADITIPLVQTVAMRDLPVRKGEEAWPVVVFSHGFPGNRLQSTELTVHLASRGYVVVAPDHWGRHTSDVLPCIWDPALDGCDLSAFVGDDPAPDQIDEALDWLQRASEDKDDPLYERVDLSRLGLFGHSAGGRTTATFGDEETRFTALLPMAGSAPVTRDVPVLNLVGECDGVIPVEDTRESHDASTNARWLGIEAAGHHAFSDICALGLADLARDELQGRDDVNTTLLGGMITLVGDGCPGETPSVDVCESFTPLDEGFDISRHYIAAWFDEHLNGGPSTEGGLFAGTTWE